MMRCWKQRCAIGWLAASLVAAPCPGVAQSSPAAQDAAVIFVARRGWLQYLGGRSARSGRAADPQCRSRVCRADVDPSAADPAPGSTAGWTASVLANDRRLGVLRNDHGRPRVSYTRRYPVPSAPQYWIYG